MPTPPSENPDDYSGSPAAAPRRLNVPRELAGERLDTVLARLMPEHSRSRLQTWIREGRLDCEGRPVTDTRLRLAGGETLHLREAPPPQAVADEAEAIALDVVFEDEHLLVVNKPAGLVVHPGSGNWSGTLLNGLLAFDEDLAELPRAGIVHRLDKDTSGLMVVAKTEIAQTDLVRQLQARTVKRQYYAIVMGAPPDAGVVDAPIGRHPTQRTRMAVIPNGREARTHYRVLEYFEGAASVECSLETGRTHQIRVHMAHLGHALIGDAVYAGRRRPPPAAQNFPRQALHAFRLGLLHPVNGKTMQWEVPIAADIGELAQQLRIAE